jgi:hypothetical protein
MSEATVASGRTPTRRSGGRRGSGRQQRASITLTGESLEAALEIAEQHHINPGDVARRAIAVLKFLNDEQEKGSILRIQSPNGESERLRVLFT